MQKINLLILSIVSIILFNCSNEGQERSTALLPLSVGAPGELFLVMDSTQWKGELGTEVRKVFMKEMEGIPREEQIFTVRYIKPERMTNSLRQVSNLVYVTSFDVKGRGARVIQGYFTPESREKIMGNENYFLTTSTDLYARDQSVMYLFGKNEETLIKNLKENSTQIINHFNRKERERMEKKIFSRTEKGIETSLSKDFGIKLKIPAGYQLALKKENFVWIRQIDNLIDKNLIIYYEDYTDFEQFENSRIIKKRDDICKKYIYEDKDTMPDSYVITETEVPFIPVVSHQVNLNGKYAVETRGLWRTYNKSMGGPFLGITVVDETKNRLYYLEGFIFSPGENQREVIREIETILNTFKTTSKSVKQK